MPRDPFSKVASGDPLQFSAQWYNAATDAAKAFAKKGVLSAEPLTQSRSSTIIRVRNDTGNSLDRFSVVGLNGPAFLPTDSEDAFLREVVFSAITPDATKHKRRYAITLDPSMVPGGYGDGHVIRAYLAGVCQVKVDLVDTSHEYGHIIDGASYLLSGRFGHARVLWTESDDPYSGYTTGLQWAIVMLGVTGSCFAIGKAYGDITARSGTTYGVGQVQLYRADGSTEDGPIERIDVLNSSHEELGAYGTGIPDGCDVAVAWDADDQAWVSPLSCTVG